MNEDLLDKVGKKLPYSEDEDYVSALMERCARRAIQASKRGTGRKRSLWIGVAAAAAVALAVTVIPALLKTTGAVATGASAALAKIECTAASVNASADLSEVLSEMSYDQLTSVSFYLTDDIDVPEY